MDGDDDAETTRGVFDALALSPAEYAINERLGHRFAAAPGGAGHPLRGPDAATGRLRRTVLLARGSPPETWPGTRWWPTRCCPLWAGTLKTPTNRTPTIRATDQPARRAVARSDVPKGMGLPRPRSIRPAVVISEFISGDTGGKSTSCTRLSRTRWIQGRRHAVSEEVADALRAPASGRQVLVQRGPRVAPEVVSRLVPAAEQRGHGGHGDDQQRVGRDDLSQVLQRDDRVLEMFQDIQARDRAGRERHVERLAEVGHAGVEVAAEGDVHRGLRAIEAHHPPRPQVASDGDHHAPRSAAQVQVVQLTAGGGRRQRALDVLLAHRVPPVVAVGRWTRARRRAGW